MADHAQETISPVLVVEDDDATLHILRFLLTREGYHVLAAEDGRKASEYIARESPPNLVLLDMMLPYVDGFQLIRQMRGREDGWRKVPIVVLTSASREKDVARALDLGATDYLVKPFKAEELLARLRRCLRNSP
jgi:DNA-binding response OmpR family regulator